MKPKKKVHNFIGSFFVYKNEIAIAVDAMRTALIAKNGAEDRAKRSLRRSWEAVQQCCRAAELLLETSRSRSSSDFYLV